MSDFWDSMSKLADGLQTANFILNIMEVGNDEIMKKLESQNQEYLEVLKEQNNLIIELLKEVKQYAQSNKNN